MQRLEKRLESAGYCIDLKILSALEQGLPQDRERLIMIGIRKDIAVQCSGCEMLTSDRNWFPWPINDKYVNAKTKFSWPEIVENGTPPSAPSGIPLELTIFSIFNKENDPSKQLNGRDCFNVYSEKFNTIKNVLNGTATI